MNTVRSKRKILRVSVVFATIAATAAVAYGLVSRHDREIFETFLASRDCKALDGMLVLDAFDPYAFIKEVCPAYRTGGPHEMTIAIGLKVQTESDAAAEGYKGFTRLVLGDWRDNLAARYNNQIEHGYEQRNKYDQRSDPFVCTPPCDRKYRLRYNPISAVVQGRTLDTERVVAKLGVSETVQEIVDLKRKIGKLHAFYLLKQRLKFPSNFKKSRDRENFQRREHLKIYAMNICGKGRKPYIYYQWSQHAGKYETFAQGKYGVRYLSTREKKSVDEEDVGRFFTLVQQRDSNLKFLGYDPQKQPRNILVWAKFDQDRVAVQAYTLDKGEWRPIDPVGAIDVMDPRWIACVDVIPDGKPGSCTYGFPEIRGFFISRVVAAWDVTVVDRAGETIGTVHRFTADPDRAIRFRNSCPSSAWMSSTGGTILDTPQRQLLEPSEGWIDTVLRTLEGNER